MKNISKKIILFSVAFFILSFSFVYSSPYSSNSDELSDFTGDFEWLGDWGGSHGYCGGLCIFEPFIFSLSSLIFVLSIFLIVIVIAYLEFRLKKNIRTLFLFCAIFLGYIVTFLFHFGLTSYYSPININNYCASNYTECEKRPNILLGVIIDKEEEICWKAESDICEKETTGDLILKTYESKSYDIWSKFIVYLLNGLFEIIFFSNLILFIFSFLNIKNEAIKKYSKLLRKKGLVLIIISVLYYVFVLSSIEFGLYEHIIKW